jgi:hypothetical protein
MLCMVGGGAWFMADNKKSAMTEERVTALEGIGFVWDGPGAAWAERPSELAEFRKMHGHCNVSQNYSENIRLGTWVSSQRVDEKNPSHCKLGQKAASSIQAHGRK